MPTKTWKLSCSSTLFNSLKQDDKFKSILNLARICNSLVFCNTCILKFKNKYNPSGYRQVINSFLFASAVLYEGFIVADNLGKYFNTHKAFRKGFAILLKNKKLKQFRQNILCKMRDKFVFHFDESVVAESLKKYTSPSYTFMVGRGSKNSEIYYILADEISLNYILKDISSSSQKKELEKILKTTVDLIVKFTDAANQLICEVLLEMGWLFKEESNGT